MSFDPARHGWRLMRGGAMPADIGFPWAKRPRSWRYGLLTTAEHANPQGALHGGILMTFADHGLSLLAWEAAPRALHDDPVEHPFPRRRRTGRFRRVARRSRPGH